MQIMTLKLVSTAVPAEPKDGAAASVGGASPGGAAGGGAAAAAAAAEDDARLTGLASGCCFAFNPFNEHMCVQRRRGRGSGT